MGYIKENPIEEVDKPEKNQFVGKFYNSSELSEVWLGHSDFSTTANTYSHLDATSKVSSLSALSGAVSLAGR